MRGAVLVVEAGGRQHVEELELNDSRTTSPALLQLLGGARLLEAHRLAPGLLVLVDEDATLAPPLELPRSSDAGAPLPALEVRGPCVVLAHDTRGVPVGLDRARLYTLGHLFRAARGARSPRHAPR